MQAVHTDEFDPGTQHPPVQTEGTVEYLELIANFTRIHLSLALSNLERVFLASDILNDLRFWRNHLHYTPGFTLKEHFMSRQTYEHITLECHSVMLHIKMFGVQCPSQPTDLEETGSDECEKTFRSFGGFSRTQGRRRNYNVLDAVDAAGDENQRNAWEGDEDSEVQLEYYGRGNQSLEYDESLHEPPGTAAADLTIHPSSAALIDAFERGLQAARARAVARGMVPPKGRLQTKPTAPKLTGEQLMQKLWLGEGHLAEEMREKADDEAELEAAGGGSDEGGGGGGSSGGGGGGDGGAADGGGGGGDGDDDDGDGPPPPPQGSAGESAACADNQRDAASTLLDSVLAVDADHQSAARPKTSALMTVRRDGKPMRVYKRTYLHETQQLDAGQKLPADRLSRIVAAATQSTKEVERAARSSSTPAAGASAGAAASAAADR